MDGTAIISDLDQMDQCTFDSGYLKQESATVVWEPQTAKRECAFQYAYTSNAITNQNHIAIEETGLFSNIDRDLRKLRSIMDDCYINQALMTNDGLLIEFPDMHHRRSEHTAFSRVQSLWVRRKKEIVGMAGPLGTWLEFEVGQNFSTPLTWKLFGKKTLTEISPIRKQIDNRALLREFKMFGVNNALPSNRAKFYPVDRRHPQPDLLIALKSIRMAQYRWREKKRLQVNLKLHLESASLSRFKNIIKFRYSIDKHFCYAWNRWKM
ncbi:hypothetical protein CAEBREN_00628 [Caenorhabditis brenneri]|uniref:Uncharacterized protein n=1 Tax=Caenorhabditis brenneri TaxID=135651 RepID=G0P9M8_CAEBE|nr:hypothetical protein CAEBREN_00628 [Caenorhabditis brenneri]